MHYFRPVIAEHPMRFGRGPVRVSDPVRASSIVSDVKLFGLTFLAGFLFVSILIG